MSELAPKSTMIRAVQDLKAALATVADAGVSVLDELLWHIGITYSPSRRPFDGHGYSRLGCWLRRRRYVSTHEAMTQIGNDMAQQFRAGLQRHEPLSTEQWGRIRARAATLDDDV